MDNSLITLLVLIGLICVVMAIAQPGDFYSLSNLQSMLYQFPEYGIMAYGVMICMIAGGIDLSLVGIANFSGIVCVSIILGMGGTTISIILGIIAALVIGMVCGAFNGFLVGYLDIPAMLVTLCGLQVFTGAGLAITTGPALNGLPDSYSNIANGMLFNAVPYTLFIFIAVVALMWFVLNCTVFGRQVYFMGSNKVAAKFSGINCLKTTMKTYILSGILGAIAGVIITSHFASAKSDYGNTYTLLTILIVVLGGVHPDGGRGKVLGVTLSILTLSLITQMFSILQVDTNFKTCAFGALLILALVFTMVQDAFSRRKEARIIAEKQ